MKNESVAKSLEKSQNVLEEKRKKTVNKKMQKKDQHVDNNCYALGSRAIKQLRISYVTRQNFLTFTFRSKRRINYYYFRKTSRKPKLFQT